MAATCKLKAVVLGGTGAVGTEVVKSLIASDAWDKIVTVGRRPVELGDELAAKAAGRLEQLTINMDNMAVEAKEAFAGADSVFCTLGTTRGDAGSAAGFRRVDLEWVEAAVALAKAGSAKHFSVVSCEGANAAMWANDWPIFGAMLYLKVKGQAEEAVKAGGFPSVSVFRPGLIDRGDRMRGGEKCAKVLGFSSINTSAFGKLMVQDAEEAAQGRRTPTVAMFRMKAMQEAAKVGVPPKHSGK